MRLGRLGFAAAFLLQALSSIVTAGEKRILLHVTPAPLAWSDSRIDEMIVKRFTRERDLRYTLNTAKVESAPEFPGNAFDIDSLADWGAELGGRYLLMVRMASERLDKRRTMHIPLILHRFETIAVADAEVRLLDLENGRMILAEPMVVEVTARRIVQADPDKDKNDPDIHVLASDKAELFRKLESAFADALHDRVYHALRNR